MLIEDLTPKIIKNLTVNNNQTIKSFLNNFENLAIQHMKRHFKGMKDIEEKTDSLLIYILNYMLDKLVFKCELLDFALSNKYRSFKLLKGAILVTLGSSVFSKSKTFEADPEQVSLLIWIISSKLITKFKTSTRPKLFKKLQNSVTQEMNNYKNTKNCKYSHKEILENDHEFCKRVISFIKDLDILSLDPNNTVSYKDETIYKIDLKLDQHQDALSKYASIT